MVVQLDGPLGHAQQRIFKVVSELAEGAPLERLWRSGEQEGSKQPAIQGGKELCSASETAGRAASSHVQPSAWLAWLVTSIQDGASGLQTAPDTRPYQG